MSMAHLKFANSKKALSLFRQINQPDPFPQFGNSNFIHHNCTVLGK